MSEAIVKKFEELLATGTQLVPLGGFEFSGYNARLQNKYLEWRKSCLETLEQSGPIGFPYKNKIVGDQNGGYFFQSSAQLIVTSIKELYEKLKASPELAAAAAPAAVAAPAPVTSTDTGGARVLKPPPKAATAAAPVAAPAPAPAPTKSDGIASNKVYVIGEQNDPLRAQLSQFLSEIGLEEVVLNRVHGQMLSLEEIQERSDVRFAFFVLNADDLTYAMFEVGHFVGKLGKGRVCILHMSDVNFPKTVPGVTVKPIVVKLEEGSLGIMKELKALGYKISF